MRSLFIIIYFGLLGLAQVFAAGPSYCATDKLQSIYRQSKKEVLVELDLLVNQKKSEAKAQSALSAFQRNYLENPRLVNKVTGDATKDSLVKIKEDGTWIVQRANGSLYEVKEGSSFSAIQKRITDPAHFHTKARTELQGLPTEVRREFGKAIFDLQNGQTLSMPLSRPMPSVGPGVSELRVKTRQGNYRIFYYTHGDTGVVVFHTFNKKTEQTPKHEIEVGRKRLQEMLNNK